MSIHVAADLYILFLFFKQKTAYEMRMSDWSSDVCSSDLCAREGRHAQATPADGARGLRRLAPSHVRIVGAAAALRRDPDDVLGGILDVARLAVDAVLRVDLQPWAAAVLDAFVNPRRTVTLLRGIVQRKINPRRYRRRSEARRVGK